MIFWMILIIAVLAVSFVVGMHLGRFREAYTEMTGMMAGMTMGMLNGFVLGFAFAALIGSISAGPSGLGAGGIGGMFWGNLFGILFGLSLGTYFGRAGGLMGIMDGAMGGVMGGSMGAMLAIMVRFEDWAILWTGVLLAIIYIVGMIGLVVLIERSAPGHAALHRLTPFFARAISEEVEEVAEEYDAAEEAARSSKAARESHPTRTPQEIPIPQRRLVDYYALLGVRRKASIEEIQDAYLEKADDANADKAQRIERALEVLTDVQKRGEYDRKLAESESSLSAGTAPVRGNGRAGGYPQSEQRQQGQQGQQGRAVAPAAPTHAGGAGGAQATVKVTSQSEHDGHSGHSGPQQPTGGRPAGGGAATNAPAGTSKGQGGSQPQGSRHGKHGKGKQGQQSQGKAGGQQYRADYGTQSRRQQVSRARYQQRQGMSPAGWVGVGAFLLAGLIAVWFVGSTLGAGANGNTQGGGYTARGGNSGQSSQQAQLESQAVVAPVGADGKQTLDLAVDGNSRGYKPSVIKVKQGVPVHFNLSVEGADPG